MNIQEIEQTYGLSATQKGMLFHTMYSPRSGLYVQQMIGQLREPLNVPAFRQAWNELVDRHAALRTSFSLAQSDYPCQQVHRRVVLPFDEQDWRSLAQAEQEVRLKDYLTVDRRLGFDLAKPPLVRLALFQLGDTDYRLVWTSHHALLDGRSRRVVLEELFALYEACCRGEHIALDPAPLFKGHIEWLASQDFSRAEGFWRHELKGLRSPTAFGIESPDMNRCDGDQQKGSLARRLSNRLTESLSGLARENQLTLNTLLQGTWALLLSRYSGDREVLFGATRSCRHSTVEGADTMVGLLINTVPVRVTVSEDRALLPWLKELRAKWIAIRDYEHTPLVKIQEWSEVPGSMPLFESLLVFENFELNAALRATARGFDQREFQLIGETNYPLIVSGYLDQQLLVKVDYDRRRFQDDTIVRLLGHLEVVLGAMVSNPGQRLAEIPILTETERERILVEWNDTGKDYPRDKCIHALFEEQAERKPAAVAVAYNDQELNYRQLNERANRLAHYLRKRGIGADCLVGICMQRSPELIVAMLGILKAGGAYVPLDTSYPRERLEFMCADTRMRVLVADKQGFEQLPGSKLEVVCLKSDREMIAQECEQNPSGLTQPDNLAYVIYTSGSTGQPKGVAITHRAISRLVGKTNYAQLGPSDRVAQVSNCSFDAATFEIWGALLHGACLVGVAKDVVLSPRHFAAEIRDREISTLFLTTALFNQLASEIPQAFRTVTHLLFGGEAADPRWVKEVLSHGAPRRLVHVYGPTESTTFATWHLTQEAQPGAVTIPIGRPISNTQIYVLDPRLRPVPLGATGQLYIGGDGLARCYLNRPELTAESFVPHPFSTDPGARLYGTGDLVRYLPDGNIEFLARADHQVKIRGFRVELGEIETALRRHPWVRQAAVLAEEGPNGTKNLIAYIVAPESPSLPANQLRDFLKEKLPDYMVPNNLVLLNSLPLTPNGKLDRDRLRKPGLEPRQPEPNAACTAPRIPTEETLARIWRQVLGKESVGIHDDFFELGGNSLLATQVISKVWKLLGIDLPVRQLFDAPTIAGLAATIGNDTPKSGQQSKVPLKASHQTRDIPLSPRQEFYWNHKSTFVDKPVFNICRVLRLRGPLREDALLRSFNDLIARHQSLRTSFSVSPSGGPFQLIHPEKLVTLPLLDLSSVAAPDREKEARNLAEAEGLTVFRLTECPLLRLKLIRLSQDERWLVLVVHHIVADGWSLKVLLKELGTLYTAYCRNERSDLAPLSIQFADYAQWQRQYLQSERERLVSYWNKQLSGDVSGLKLPFDYPRPTKPTLRASRKTVSLPLSLRVSLSQLGQRQHASELMVLLSAFKVLLYAYTGQPDIVTGSSDTNRSDLETADIIGLFTNIILFRANLSGNPTFLEILSRVRNVVLESHQYLGLSLELLESDCRRDDSNGDPMYQCRFLEAPESSLNLCMGELDVDILPREQCLMRSDLRVFAGVTDKGIEMRWDYSTDLFKPETIHVMVQRYHSLLEQIVLNPRKRLSDFSLDSLDKRDRKSPSEHTVREFQAAGVATTDGRALVLPRSQTEETLVRIWRQVLGKESVGVHDNFFDLGGNSLLAMQVISHVWKALGVDLPIRQLFDAPSVAGLAESIRRDDSLGRELQKMPLRKVPRSHGIPLSYRQERGLNSKNIDIEKGAGNIGRILRLRGKLQIEALQEALNDLIARHESLRTSFIFSGKGEPLQRIRRKGRISISTIDLESLAPLDREKEARRLAEEESISIFSVTESPLLRVKLLRLSQDEHWMVTVIHHLIADGWSLKVFFQELGTIYTAHCRNEKPDLPEIPIQFADYAFCQREYLQGKSRNQLVSFWRQRLSGKLSSLKLPFDHPRPKVPTFRARRMTVFLPTDLQKSLSGLRSGQPGTEFMVELAAFNLLLHLYTSQTDLLLGTSIAGRNQIETVNVIGSFADTLLFRSDLSGNPPFLELVTRTRNLVLEAYQHQALPYSELVKLVDWVGDSGSIPNQCCFFEAPDTDIRAAMAGLEVELLPRERCPMRQDLRVFAGATDKGIEMRWDYSTDLFKPETIHVMVQRYHSLLEQIVLNPNKRLSDFSLDSLDTGESVSQRTGRDVELANTSQSSPADKLASSQTGVAKHAPLSFAQQRLWFLDQMEPGSSAYNLNQLFRITGHLNAAALEQALNAIIARHETLRTTFAERDGQPVQVIDATLKISMTVLDFESLPEETRQAEAHRAAAKEAQEPFDLRSGPLLRAMLFRLGASEHWLQLSLHHIVSDGWSMSILQRELSAFYDAFNRGISAELPKLPIQYADYAIWQQHRAESQQSRDQLAYWKQHLNGGVPVLRLPTDRPRPEVQTYQGARQLITLPITLKDSLEELSRRHRCTLFMTLLAAFKTLLYRLTLQEDITVGVPTSGRAQPETEGLIGFFVNPLPWRTNVSDGPTFQTLLHRIRDNALETYAYQDCPFEKLVEELQPERSLNHTPLFQVMLNVWGLAANSFDLPGLKVEMLERTEAKSKFDLTLYVWEHAEELRLSLVYNATLFDQVRMSEFLGQLRRLLEQVVEDPEKPIRSYSLVTPHFQAVLPNPAEKLPEPSYEMVAESFAAWVARASDHPAVCQGDRTWSYGELSLRARNLAVALSKNGMQPGDVVVVAGPRSFGLVSSFMGILIGGGILLPLDPNLPSARQRLLLEEANAKHICHIGQWNQEDSWMRELMPLRSLLVDSDDGRLLGAPPVSEEELHSLPHLSPNSPAYIFFTSGTTGTPKGVLGCHKSLSHFLAWQKHAFNVCPQDRCAQLTNLSFDVVLRDIFLPLVSGAILCLPEESDLTEVLPWLERQGITLLHVVPSRAETWLASVSEKVTLQSLRWIFFAGEPLSGTLVRQWRKTFRNSCQIANLYGPTETTMVKCFYIVPPDNSPGVQPVGKPMPQTQALVLTEGSQICGLGEPGEIVIRTPFRSLGYVNTRKDEENRRFVRSAFRNDPNDLLYFTGDRGRYLPDGSLEILGRLDDQLKIRGVRVEPGEVTATLCQAPQVRTSVVVARKKGDEDVLVAYVVPTVPGALTAAELKSFLSQQLPVVMVPHTFIFVDHLPLMPNGKVDRRALPEPDFERLDENTGFVAPRTPQEEMIARIWCDELGLHQVGIHDNFFDLGGHSLLALKLCSKMSAATDHVISVRSLFLYPSIATLVEALVKFPPLNQTTRIKEVSLRSANETSASEQPLQSFSPNLKLERRSLLSLLGVGKVPPVDAAAVGCLPHLVLKEPNISREEVVDDWYQGMPFLHAISETSLGRIGIIRIPRFRWELYNNAENLMDLMVEALELARQIGARTVSLTGLIPSATDYGRAIVDRVKERPELPLITTGHATTGATVVLSILKILEESGRELPKERVGFLGLGSIGTTALRLMLRCLPYPNEIVLCDIYSKLNVLESIRKQLKHDFGFQGTVSLLGATSGIPASFYESTLIIGATNVPDVLDIGLVKEGTLIVDDSAPHCFKTEDAIERFVSREDILFTQGGMLQAPDTIHHTRYLPRQMERKAPKFCREILARSEPFQITGCIFSGLLSARHTDLKPTVGLVDDQAAWQHYQRLVALGFQASRLQVETFILPQAIIKNFRSHFGLTLSDKQPSQHRSLAAPAPDVHC